MNPFQCFSTYVGQCIVLLQMTNDHQFMNSFMFTCTTQNVHVCHDTHDRSVDTFSKEVGIDYGMHEILERIITMSN